MLFVDLLLIVAWVLALFSGLLLDLMLLICLLFAMVVLCLLLSECVV